ncbi:hypothetical protein TNCT_398321, partial [Trichonephila clavata]
VVKQLSHGLARPFQVAVISEKLYYDYYMKIKRRSLEKDIREEITVDGGRKMLIEEKDINNIKRDFNFNGYIKRHEVDEQNYAQSPRKMGLFQQKGSGHNYKHVFGVLNKKI